MNTSQLIEELKKLDPSGEIPVCIGNSEILLLDKVPGYYDGCLERLIFKENDRNVSNVIGVKLVSPENKIRLLPYSIDDALFDNTELPVEIEGEPEGGYFTGWVSKLREENRKIISSIRKDQVEK